MKIRRVMLAAPKSGSGKTTITCALLQILKDQKEPVFACKCGPDYIDPMFHETVLGIPSQNLDTFFSGEYNTRALLLKNRKENDLIIMEGVMGLFDGLGGVREEGSSYHLAKITKTPIVLVIDAKGMGQSLLPLISGFLSYDTEHLIRGVILNKMSKHYFSVLKPIIEKELGIEVLGYVPEDKKGSFKSRHLGLILPKEIPDIQNQMKEIASRINETVSVKALKRIAEEAEEWNAQLPTKIEQIQTENAPILAVAKDEAFCFYYKENLNLFKEYGAKLQYFSPLHDKELPNKCDGILFGGGYPELYLKELSENKSMKKSIREAFANRMPFVAECGGFMYLHEWIQGKDGIKYPMVGIVEGGAYDTEKIVRFGYIELQEKAPYFLSKNGVIKGHEFHYFDSTDSGTACIARKPSTGRGYECIKSGEHYFLGFPHLYYPSNPEFVEKLVQKAKEYRRRIHCK